MPLNKEAQTKPNQTKPNKIISIFLKHSVYQQLAISQNLLSGWERESKIDMPLNKETKPNQTNNSLLIYGYIVKVDLVI